MSVTDKDVEADDKGSDGGMSATTASQTRGMSSVCHLDIIFSSHFC